jgi:hypothetical protein
MTALRCSAGQLIHRGNDRWRFCVIELREAFNQRSQALRHILGFGAQRVAKALANAAANSICVDVVELNIRDVAM